MKQLWNVLRDLFGTGSGARVHDLHSEARHNWSTFKSIVEQRDIAGRPYGTLEREAFELLRASMIYQIDGLTHFPGDRLHDEWRVTWRALPPRFLMEMERPSFGGLLPDPASDIVAEMHLASAAVRLPVALQKTIEACPQAATSFPTLWDAAPHCWPRQRLYHRFARLKSLGECTCGGPLGTSPEDSLENAITVVMVLRDDFAHGEAGDPTLGDYMRERQGVLDTLHACRIVEAETFLIRWAIEHFR